MVSTSGLDKAAVLAALYNASRPQGLGFLHYEARDMTTEEARQLLTDFGTNFDYLKGRVMKIDLSSDLGFEEWLYDRDNGRGEAQRVIDRLREAKGFKVKPQRNEPLWKGPESQDANGGVTQGLLASFLVDRERFRIKVVEGLKEVDSFNHRLEYGQMWHTCEEYHAQGQAWEGALQLYARDLCQQYQTQQEQINHWYEICKLQFPIYVKYWAKHPDVKERLPLLQEQTFNVPYKLPSGRVVRLRGKWDSVDLIGKGKTAGIYLQENKTKGDLDERQLQRQLLFDLQTMVYIVALVTQRDEYDWPDHPIRGIRYNCIRRPLAGGKNSIRQHQPSKSNPKGESKREFYDRLAQLIATDPEHYFMRWKIELTPQDIERFKVQFLNPVLEQLCDWWDWISSGQDVWAHHHRSNAVVGDMGNPNILHYRMPYGVYSPLLDGGMTSVDEYLLTGSELGLERTDNLFPEL